MPLVAAHVIMASSGWSTTSNMLHVSDIYIVILFGKCKSLFQHMCTYSHLDIINVSHLAILFFVF